MTIRAKLAASINVLLMMAMGMLGWSVIAVQRSYKKADLLHAAAVIENSVRRVALDTLLQGDELQLVSYVNFLKGEYPALAYAKFVWASGGRSHKVDLGSLTVGSGIIEHEVEVSDPADAKRRVQVVLGIDEGSIEQQVSASQVRLQRIILTIWALTSLAGLLLSYFLARTWTQPLARLGTLAETIGRGRLGGRLEWNSTDEIGRLVEAFNRMSGKLEELEDQKRNFVSSVSHELRSPLGAIASFLHLVEGKLRASADPGAAQSLSYLERTQANIRRLETFITDLLDAAKIEKGKLECVLKPIRLQDVAAEVCQFFLPRASEQGVVLVNAAPVDIPMVEGDPERLRQVLINLVSNSLKFTGRDGRVTIRAEQFREKSSRWVEVTVEDTGRGMSARDLEGMFKLFSQGANIADRVVGTRGTGLGLYICKSIVEQHGGQISVRSAPSQGTAVAFTVRVSVAEQREPQPSAALGQGLPDQA